MNERSFRRAVERVRGSRSGEELASSVRAALAKILGQPQDRELLASLTAQAETITARLPKNAAGGPQAGEIRQAAVRCVLLLESAKKGGTGADKPPLFKDPRVITVMIAAALVAIFYMWLLK